MYHILHTNFPVKELRAMPTSLAFHQYHSLRQVMDAAPGRADAILLDVTYVITNYGWGITMYPNVSHRIG